MKKSKRSPSRIKYEQKNPTISARLPVETRDKLLANLKILGMSVADAFRVLAGELEVKAIPIEEAKKRYMVIYKCAVCGKYVVIVSPKAKEAAAKYMTEHGWGHSECHKQVNKS